MITSDHKRNCRNNNITNINSLQTSFSMNYNNNINNNKEQNKTAYNGYICNFKQFCKLNKRKSILVFLINIYIHLLLLNRFRLLC